MTTAATSVVSESLPCRECGYDLLHLTIDDRCPECGRAAEWSMRGDLLRFSDPAYLRALHRGAMLVILSIVLQVLYAVGLVAAGFAWKAPMPPAAQVFVSLISMVLAAMGWWLLSAPDPGRLAVDKPGGARLALRIALVFMAASTLLNVSLMAVGTTAVAALMIFAVGLASTLAFIGFFFASVLYLRALALRVPAPNLAWRAVVVLWLGPSGVIAVLAGAVLAGLIGAISMVLTLLGGLLILVCALSCLVLIIRLRAELKKALDFAAGPEHSTADPVAATGLSA